MNQARLPLKAEANSLQIFSFTATEEKSHMVHLILEEVVEEFEDDPIELIFVNTNAKRHQQLVDRYGVAETPVSLLIFDGEIMDHFFGILPAKKIRKKIHKTLDQIEAQA